VFVLCSFKNLLLNKNILKLYFHENKCIPFTGLRGLSGDALNPTTPFIQTIRSPGHPVIRSSGHPVIRYSGRSQRDRSSGYLVPEKRPKQARDSERRKADVSKGSLRPDPTRTLHLATRNSQLATHGACNIQRISAIQLSQISGLSLPSSIQTLHYIDCYPSPSAIRVSLWLFTLLSFPPAIALLAPSVIVSDSVSVVFQHHEAQETLTDLV